jgi:hypothetical protein
MDTEMPPADGQLRALALPDVDEVLAAALERPPF